MSPAMALTSTVFGGLILIAAGVYQLTPFRDACLQHFRGPLEFVSRHWMLMAYIFLEKLVSRGMLVRRLASIMLIVWGGLVLLGILG